MLWDAYLIKFKLFIVECKGVFFNLIIVFASIVHCVIHSWWLVSSPAIFLAGYIWWSNQRVIFMIRVLPSLACNELCIRATNSHHQMQSGASTSMNLGTRNEKPFWDFKIWLKDYIYPFHWIEALVRYSTFLLFITSQLEIRTLHADRLQRPSK